MYELDQELEVTYYTYGEAIYNRRNQIKNTEPHKTVKKGVVFYVGPEAPFPSVDIVRCKDAKGDNFSFYPKDVGSSVEVIIKEKKQVQHAFFKVTARLNTGAFISRERKGKDLIHLDLTEAMEELIAERGTRTINHVSFVFVDQDCEIQLATKTNNEVIYPFLSFYFSVGFTEDIYITTEENAYVTLFKNVHTSVDGIVGVNREVKYRRIPKGHK